MGQPFCAFQDGHDADGGRRDAFGAPGEAPGLGKHGQRPGHFRPVVERFAHTHEHDVRQFVGFVDVHQLGKDLRGRKVPVEASTAGHAEAAAHFAADLRGDAGGGAGQAAFGAVLELRDHHRFDEFAFGAGGEEVFACAVFRGEGLDGAVAPHFVGLGECGAGGFRQIGHFIEGPDTPHVKPLGELPARVGRQSGRCGDGLQFGKRLAQ